MGGQGPRGACLQMQHLLIQRGQRRLEPGWQAGAARLAGSGFARLRPSGAGLQQRSLGIALEAGLLLVLGLLQFLLRRYVQRTASKQGHGCRMKPGGVDSGGRWSRRRRCRRSRVLVGGRAIEGRYRHSCCFRHSCRCRSTPGCSLQRAAQRLPAQVRAGARGARGGWARRRDAPPLGSLLWQHERLLRLLLVQLLRNWWWGLQNLLLLRRVRNLREEDRRLVEQL